MAQQCPGAAPWALEQAGRQQQGLAAAVAPQEARSTLQGLEQGSLEAALWALGAAARTTGRPPPHLHSELTHEFEAVKPPEILHRCCHNKQLAQRALGGRH